MNHFFPHASRCLDLEDSIFAISQTRELIIHFSFMEMNVLLARLLITDLNSITPTYISSTMLASLRAMYRRIYMHASSYEMCKTLNTESIDEGCFSVVSPSSNSLPFPKYAPSCTSIGQHESSPCSPFSNLDDCLPYTSVCRLIHADAVVTLLHES